MTYTVNSYSDVVSETPYINEEHYFNEFVRANAHTSTNNIINEIEQLLVEFDNADKHGDRDADIYLNNVEQYVTLLQHRYQQKTQTISL